MLPSLLLVLVLLAAAAAAYYYLYYKKKTVVAVTSSPPPPEKYTQIGVSRRHVLPEVPKPPVDNSPLTPHLLKAVDPAVPAPAAGEAVPHDEQEVRRLMAGVLQRVNDKSPGLQLHLVAVDSVRKSVDRFKTLKYEAHLDVYSKSKNIAAKLVAAVDLTAGGKMYVRELRVHGGAARDDKSGAAPSNGVGFEEKYAAFQPAVRY